MFRNMVPGGHVVQIRDAFVQNLGNGSRRVRLVRNMLKKHAVILGVSGLRRLSRGWLGGCRLRNRSGAIQSGWRWSRRLKQARVDTRVLRGRRAQKQWRWERRPRSQVEDKVALVTVLVRVEHTPSLSTHTFHTIGMKATNGQIPLDIIRVNSEHRNDRMLVSPFSTFTISCVVLHGPLVEGTFRFANVDAVVLKAKEVGDV